MEYMNEDAPMAVGPGVYVLTCAFCSGRGHCPVKMTHWSVTEWSHRVVCPVCDGTGVLKVKSLDVPVRDAYCCGSGHEPCDYVEGGAAEIPCHKCGGIGVRSLIGKIEIAQRPTAIEDKEPVLESLERSA